MGSHGAKFVRFTPGTCRILCVCNPPYSTKADYSIDFRWTDPLENLLQSVACSIDQYFLTAESPGCQNTMSWCERVDIPASTLLVYRDLFFIYFTSWMGKKKKKNDPRTQLKRHLGTIWKQKNVSLFPVEVVTFLIRRSTEHVIWLGMVKLHMALWPWPPACKVIWTGC